MNPAWRCILLIVGLLCVIALPVAYRLSESSSSPAETSATPIPTPAPPERENGVREETHIDAPRLRENLAKLAALPHRLAGSVMGRRAGDLILEQLQQVGFSGQDLLVQSIPVTQVQMNADDCWLEQGGQRFPMLPMRPNGLALSVTPEEGIQAATVYLAHGRPEDFRDKALAGRIAVFDFDCGSSWIEAFAHGAAAVIFLGPCEGGGHKWVPAHAPMPRFYVDAPIGQRAGLLTGQTVRLFSRSRFAPLEGRNIFAFIRGTKQPDEVLALSCPYDTFGPIPLRVAAPRKSANIAGLIEAAAYLRAHPPARSVLICFFDNDAQEQAGQLWFDFARLATSGDNDTGSLDRMIAECRQEQRLLHSKLEAMAHPAGLTQRNPHEPIIESLRSELNGLIESADDLSAAGISELHLIQARAIDKTLSDRLTADLAAAESRHALLRELRLAMASNAIPSCSEAARSLFTEYVEALKQTLNNRVDEVGRDEQRFVQCRQLSALFNGRTLLASIFFNLAPAAQTWTIGTASVGQAPFESDWGGYAYVANSSLAQWFRQLQELPSTRQRWPEFGGYPSKVVPESGMWRASAQSVYAIELSNAGAGWPDGALPSEPAADAQAYATRLTEAFSFVVELAGRPELASVRIPARVPSFAFNFPRANWAGQYDGCTIRSYSGSAADAAIPVAGATIWVQSQFTPPAERKFPDDQWGSAFCTSNQNGNFALLTQGGTTLRATIAGATFTGQGQINGITQFHPNETMGTEADGSWNSPGAFEPRADAHLALFDAPRAVGIYHISDISLLPRLTGLQLLDGESDLPLTDLNLSIADDFLVVYPGRTERLKVLRNNCLLLNSSPGRPSGDGYPTDRPAVNAAAAGAQDVWSLNEDRLGRLRQHGLLQSALEAVHTTAESELTAAATTQASNPTLAAAHYEASLLLSNRVYLPARRITNDLVQAVVILLLLAVPFAFILERLIIASPNVYKQIGGFAGFFLLTFATLYKSHPAFHFTTVPAAVLLAFLIIMLSGLVIFLMWRRFEYEVRLLQGVATASHQSTQNLWNTFGAAIALGVSSMRRRPVRTMLTSATILLLTATILFFGSFTSNAGVQRFAQGVGAPTPWIEVRSTPDLPGISADSLRMLDSRWNKEAEHFVRQSGVAPDETELAGRLPDGRVFTVAGWATLSARDVTGNPRLREALSGDIEGFLRAGGIFLPNTMLHPPAGPGQIIQLLGRSFVFRGMFDTQKIREVRSLDGVSVLPLNVKYMERLLNLQYPRDKEAVRQKLHEAEPTNCPTLEPDEVVLIDPQDNIAAQSVVFFPQDDRTTDVLASTMATMLDCRITACSGGQIYQAQYSTQWSTRGYSGIAIPLVLGGMIIFGTMLSSVSDRSKEISTFSALGLAPRHVATLFLSEAAAYALVGGVGGYLSANVVQKAIEWLARRGLSEPPEMNNSSLNAMLTILIVMATVLLSTIYPAYKASRAANPGVRRRWTISKPVGDIWHIDFPFTVSSQDLIGLIGFLEEHLLSHRAKSIGSFAADDVVVTRNERGFSLSARISLSPFDQGVSQHFQLSTQSTDIPEIDALHIDVRRLSGSPAIWTRSNRVFVDEMRRQFIFWRTIPKEQVEKYRQATIDRFHLEVEVAL